MASSHIIFVSLFAAIIISLDLAACRGVGSGGRGVGGGRGGGYSGSGTTGGEDIFLPSTKTIIHFSFYLILYFARVQHLAIAFFCGGHLIRVVGLRHVPGKVLWLREPGSVLRLQVPSRRSGGGLGRAPEKPLHPEEETASRAANRAGRGVRGLPRRPQNDAGVCGW